MSSIRPSILERLFGIAAGFFLAAMLVYVGVHLIESVLPTLGILAVIVGLTAGAVWWLRSRSNSW